MTSGCKELGTAAPAVHIKAGYSWEQHFSIEKHDLIPVTEALALATVSL